MSLLVIRQTLIEALELLAELYSHDAAGWRQSECRNREMAQRFNERPNDIYGREAADCEAQAQQAADLADAIAQCETYIMLVDRLPPNAASSASPPQPEDQTQELPQDPEVQPPSPAFPRSLS